MSDENLPADFEMRAIRRGIEWYAKSKMVIHPTFAKQVAGKEEFFGFVDWYKTMVDELGVTVKLNTEVSANDLDDFDEVIVATGVIPRDPQIPGQNRDSVVSYIDVLNGTAKVGERVAVIGAGGIGFDVSEYLVHEGESTTLNLPEWMKEWGVADPAEHRSGLAPEGPQPHAPARQVTLLQRKAEKPGKRFDAAALERPAQYVASGAPAGLST